MILQIDFSELLKLLFVWISSDLEPVAVPLGVLLGRALGELVGMKVGKAESPRLGYSDGD